MTPTENGLALYHHARLMLRQLDQALSIARQESGQIQGMVSVGLPATTVLAIGVPPVRRIRSRYPGIVLNVVEGTSGHLSHMIRLCQIDLAILFNSDVASDLAATTLSTRSCSPSCRAHSPLVASEVRDTARQFVVTGQWQGVALVA